MVTSKTGMLSPDSVLNPGKFHSEEEEEEPYRKPSAEMDNFLNQPTDSPKRSFLDPPR